MDQFSSVLICNQWDGCLMREQRLVLQFAPFDVLFIFKKTYTVNRMLFGLLVLRFSV